MWCVAVVVVLAHVALALSSSTPPIPPPVLDLWQKEEIGVMITFNMATMATNITGNGFCVDVGGHAGWLPDPDYFNPYLLNTDEWMEAIVALGGKYAVLVTQHCAGFSLFPTRDYVKNATGFDYTYSVESSGWGGGKRDVVGEFVASCQKYGVRPGFYYSLNHNYYLNTASSKVQNSSLIPGQANVTQAQYNAIATAQMQLLWSRYGPIHECWFDGGINTDELPTLPAMLSQLQPDAVYFGGSNELKNTVRWVGTESGLPPYPIWSTSGPHNVGPYGGGGDPNGTDWHPAESDTTLQLGDHWFYNPIYGYRGLEELKQVYHHTVGQNSNLLLNLAPNKTGNVPERAMQLYKELGQWIRDCYGLPDESVSAHNATLSAVVGAAGADRFIVMEDQQYGQLVRAYTVTANGVVVGGGSSIGHKRIQFLPRALASGAVVRVDVTQSLEGLVPYLTLQLFSGAKC